MFSPQKLLLLLFKKNQRKLVKLHDHFKKKYGLAIIINIIFRRKKKFVKLISRKIIIHQCMNKILMVSIITKTTTIPMRTTSYTSNGIFFPQKNHVTIQCLQVSTIFVYFKKLSSYKFKKKILMQDLLN